MKKFLHIFLIAALVIAVLGIHGVITAGAYDDAAAFQYTLSDMEEATVTYYFGDDPNPVIPAVIDGFPVTAIGDDLFYGVNWIESISIPASVKTIGENAFCSCEKLKTVYIEDLAAWCRIDFGDSESNPLSNRAQLHLNGSPVTELTIPQGITEISPYLFTYCQSITGVTLPEGVVRIGEGAFRGCSNLTSVSIPASVRQIDSMAFMLCSNLQEFTGGTFFV